MKKTRFVLQQFSVVAILLSLSAYAQQATVETGKQPAAAHVLSTGVGSPTAAPPSAKLAAEEEEMAAPSNPVSTGIKVHGHWVLEVKGKDGKLVERREFNNSLVTVGSMISGDQLLAGLLSGNVAAGKPVIGFFEGNAAAAGDRSQYCLALNNSQTMTDMGYECFGMVGVSAQVSFNPTVQWVLSGNYTVPPGLTSVAGVATLVNLCANSNASFMNPGGAYHVSFQGTSQGNQADVSSASCAAGTITLPEWETTATLTYATVPSGPLAVTPGQVITVTVTISFS
jgi:hypothetical protein